jgi:hypothetical protein
MEEMDGAGVQTRSVFTHSSVVPFFGTKRSGVLPSQTYRRGTPSGESPRPDNKKGAAYVAPLLLSSRDVSTRDPSNGIDDQVGALSIAFRVNC